MLTAVLFSFTLAAPPVNEVVIDGNVRSVQGASVEITRDNGKVLTVQVTQESKLYVDGKVCELSTFKAGSVIRCVYDADTKAILQLTAYVELDRPRR